RQRLIANTFTPSPHRSDVVAFRRSSTCSRLGMSSPFPIGNLGHIVAVPANELLVLDELVADCLFGMRGSRAQLGNTVDYVVYQVESIEIISHAHVKRPARCALFFVATHVQVLVAGPPVG